MCVTKPRWSEQAKRIITISIYGLVQDCSNSIANALELLQSCTKLLICPHLDVVVDDWHPDDDVTVMFTIDWIKIWIRQLKKNVISVSDIMKQKSN